MDMTMEEFFKLTAPPKHILLKESLGIGTRFPCFLVSIFEGKDIAGSATLRIPCRLETGSVVTIAGHDGIRKMIQLHLVGLTSPDQDYNCCSNLPEGQTKEEHLEEHVRRAWEPHPKFYFEVESLDFSWAMYK